jgi:putative nucleotidyltransferase with HDIG domain
MIELRDSYTYQHQHNVLMIVTKICNELDMTGNERRCIKWAAELHDIGKIYIPAEILTKSTTLTTIERYLIQSHPELGYQIVHTIPFHCTPKVADIVLQHHERLDGSGYPNHLTEYQISLGAKIIAVADVYDAMCSHRPYRPGLGIGKAVEELVQGANKVYDVKMVKILLDLLKKENKISFNFKI